MTKRPLDMDLNLPDAPEFVSRPPRYTASEMIKLCEPLLPYWNRQREKFPPPLPTGDPFRLIEDDLAAPAGDQPFRKMVTKQN